jgi:hypothetical protein
MPMPFHGFICKARHERIEGQHGQRHRRHDLLIQGLEVGTKFILENPRTRQRVEVNVVRLAQLNPALVPVEFLAAAPQLWNISFPSGTNANSSKRMRHPRRSEGSLFKNQTRFRLRTPLHANPAVIQERAEPTGRSRATVCRCY